MVLVRFAGIARTWLIVAMGAAGDLTLADSLKAAGFTVHAIGDATGVGYIEGAMAGALAAVKAIAGT